MADRILVLRGGRLQQLADPHTLYHQPTNEFVARFIGSVPMNFLPVVPGTSTPMVQLVDTTYGFALPTSTWVALERRSQGLVRCTLGIRPEDILLQPTPHPDWLPATLTLLEPLGREVLVSVTCGPYGLKVLVPAPCDLWPATPVWLNLSKGPHHFFDLHNGVALSAC